MNKKNILNPTDYTQEEWHGMFMKEVEKNHNLQFKIDKAIEILREMQKDDYYSGIGYELSYIEKILKEE